MIAKIQCMVKHKTLNVQETTDTEYFILKFKDLIHQYLILKNYYLI